MLYAIKSVRCQTAETIFKNYILGINLKNVARQISPAFFHATRFDHHNVDTFRPSTPLLANKVRLNVAPVRFVSNGSSTWLHEAYFDSKLVLFVQDVFLRVHETTGLPWWSSIALTVLGLRFCTTLPLAVYQQYVIAKYENLLPEIKTLSEELMKETAMAAKKFNLNEKQAKQLFFMYLRKHKRRLIERDNCHPFKASLLLFVQLPLWFSQSLSLRNMVYMLPIRNVASEITFLQLSCGGLFWVTDLTLPDQTWLLPLLLGLINFANIELHVLRKAGAPTRFQRLLTNCFRVLTVVMIPVAASVPSCLAVSWLTSSAYGLIQNVVLFQPKVRRMFRIPKTPSESETPLADIIRNLKVKLKIDQ